MKRKLILIMAVVLTTLTTWSLRAGVNPAIVEVDLDIDYLAADDPQEWTPGGFVCVEGRRKITLQKVQPADWGTTAGDSYKRVRLSWGSTNIAIYSAATGGVAVVSGTDYANADLPKDFWVEGVTVSATAGTSSTPGPETILAQAIPDGMYDRVAFTVYHVDSITVMPKGAPEGWTPPEPVTIGAGAIHSPAHQADVTIQVLPAVAGIPVDVRLIRGLSHEPGKEAELDMGTQIATGGGEAVTVLTGAGGTIGGDLTSSDVGDMDCTIQVCATEKEVRFTWDEYPEQDEWTLEPDYLPVLGVLTNHLVLRHHRDPATCDPTNYTPWAPFNDHDIRFFVEKVEYWDAEGNLCETNNTAEAPADLSAWATFPTNPVTTDADGCVTELLTILTNANLCSVTVVAYNWSVFNEVSQQAAPSAQRDPRIDQFRLAGYTTSEGCRPFLAYASGEVPVCRNTEDTENAFNIDSAPGGRLAIYLGLESANANDWAFEIRTNTTTGASGPVEWSEPVPPDVAKIVLTHQDVPGNSLLIAPDNVPNRFNFYRIVVRSFNQYSVKVHYKGKYKFGFMFNAVKARVDAPYPISVTTNMQNYALFPLTIPHTNSAFPPVSVVVTGRVAATLYQTGAFRDHIQHPIEEIKTSSGTGFELSTVANEPVCFGLKGVSEGDDILKVQFKINARHFVRRIGDIYPPNEQRTNYVMNTRTFIHTSALAGSFTNLHLVCPNMHIVSPKGTLPPEGEDGAEGYSPSICPLLVFDMPGDEEGKCLMACETPQLTGLSSDFVKGLVWNNVEWLNPSVSTVTNVTTDTPSGEPWKTEFRYTTMPTHNNAFGNTNLVLRFKDRPAWKWDQPVQFRFNRTGTNAASRVIEAGTLSTNYVAAGNPNWYVYWQQVANGFSKTDGSWPSGKFGPQAQRMVYSNSLYGTSGTTTNAVGLYDGRPVYDYGSTNYLWSDEIRIFDENKDDIYKYITTIHHENGHRQSDQLPNSQGGWGEGLGYSLEKDEDRDIIHDTWEEPGG